MNENLNLVEILKDCPSGMKLYSPLCGKCVFDRLNMGTIICKKQNTQEITFTSEGYYMLPVFNDCECMLFPSKDQRDWSKWHRPFVDGDIVTYDDQMAIFKKYINIDDDLAECYVFFDSDLEMDIDGDYYVKDLATEEEKAKLFKAIKSHGYKWLPETKTLEKLIVPKFKVGDKVRNKANGRMTGTIIALYEEVYEVKNPLGNEFPLDFRNQDNWELVPNKFDPKTLKPFDKVLVSCNDEWFCDFFSHYDAAVVKFNCICTGGCPYDYCVPYNDDTKHLIGKSIEDAPEFYRYWEE